MKATVALCFLAYCFMMLITSCDPGRKYTEVIQNNSFYDLRLRIISDSAHSMEFFYPDDTVIIPKFTSVALGKMKSLGGVGYVEPCWIFADSMVLEVLNDTNRIVTFNPNYDINWRYSSDRTGMNRTGSCECRAIILNSHIE
jgi:hypothetical protein